MRYIALLRGINVGTSGRIRMNALKALMEQAGFSRVETYIQSGNVVLDSDLPEAAVKDAIEIALKNGANISTTAVLRTAEELHALLRGCPFSPERIERAQAVNTEGESFFVCLLPQEPDVQQREKLYKLEPSDDGYVLVGRDIYLLVSQSIRLSKLAIRLQKIFPEMTNRNWNTIRKLDDLSLL